MVVTNRIEVLPPDISERIAAGEIIERPSSVVKELVENSLDAGASEVSVTLIDGGKGLIEVLDNGHGMTAQDLKICVKRHATSKLRTLDDLEKIATLGFRGEALPSVAAASHLSIISRFEDSEKAYELKGTNGEPTEVTFGHFLTSQHGTRVRAESLFSEIPARLKFMKSSRSELSQVKDWLERLSLSRPDVGFRLISDDKKVLDLRPSETPDRFRSIFASGADDTPIIHSVYPKESELPGAHDTDIKIEAYWLQGLSVPTTRKLIQKVNGRILKDRVLQHALLTPFRQSLLPGQFPALYLCIDIDPAQIDVNVHPTKTEVRFLNSNKVFRLVQNMIQEMVSENGSITAASNAGGRPLGPMKSDEPVRKHIEPHSWTTNRGADTLGAWKTAEPPENLESEMTSAIGAGSTKTPAGNRSALTEESASPRSSESQASLNPFFGARFSGSLFDTYILYESGEELRILDQHAAHERIRFEKLKKQILSKDEVDQQNLLLPESVKFDPSDRSLLETRLSWLERLGFEAEVFGENDVLFRAIPAAWGSENLRIRLKSLVEKLLLESQDADVLVDETLFEKLASEACHSSVRAGDRLSYPEAKALIHDLFQCEHPWNCPHGRPTVVRVPKSRFEEWFQRRIPK